MPLKYIDFNDKMKNALLLTMMGGNRGGGGVRQRRLTIHKVTLRDTVMTTNTSCYRMHIFQFTGYIVLTHSVSEFVCVPVWVCLLGRFSRKLQ